MKLESRLLLLLVLLEPLDDDEPLLSDVPDVPELPLVLE